MKKKFITLLLLVAILPGCNLVESVRWFIGDVDYGKIKGTVYDPDGEVIEGASIVAYVPETGVVVGSDFTDADGRYMISRLSPGVYTVAIRSVGYDFKNIENVTVITAEVNRIDFEDIFRVDVNNWYSFEDANPYGKTILGEYYAQSFIPGQESIRAVACYIFGNANDFRIEIRADNSGEPAAAAVASEDAGACTSVAKVYFDEIVAVTPGQVYWIVIYTSSANYHFLAVDKYTDGMLKYSADGTSWSDPGATEKDMTFTTFY